jgi:hypothetical protein
MAMESVTKIIGLSERKVIQIKIRMPDSEPKPMVDISWRLSARGGVHNSRLNDFNLLGHLSGCLARLFEHRHDGLLSGQGEGRHP